MCLTQPLTAEQQQRHALRRLFTKFCRSARAGDESTQLVALESLKADGYTPLLQGTHWILWHGEQAIARANLSGALNIEFL